ncbi:tRNA preQ1(34) S-adenosylmethionine ribosyltransferase-isomerase QueA [Candidatus Uhrbacteria bacterium]|nr:tRNA preQ1(34) S-adenosylmethionine ribosyltransferase-isomerase QueA [Candidatus Uhrbacteria bacterium]
MNRLDALLERYDYAFPKALIAQTPAHPRDSARILVYDRATGRVVEDIFANLAKHLPPKSLLVFNDTKVVPARITVRKATGGAVRLLFLGIKNGKIEALADRQLETGAVLTVDKLNNFIVQNKKSGIYGLKPSFPAAKIYDLLERYGVAPLPPYIKKATLAPEALKREYQSVFARTRGSVAAPTASLHFTPRLLAKLEKAGHEIRFVTLHVNLGTFAPLSAGQIEKNRLHSERYTVGAKTAAAINAAKATDRPIIAVGTTVARTLESAIDAHGRLKAKTAATEIFIREGYRFKIVDGMITNFHVPRSSLLMLVSALAGRETLQKLYRRAIRKRFRLFSFGDGMFIKP